MARIVPPLTRSSAQAAPKKKAVPRGVINVSRRRSSTRLTRRSTQAPKKKAPVKKAKKAPARARVHLHATAC